MKPDTLLHTIYTNQVYENVAQNVDLKMEFLRHRCNTLTPIQTQSQ